MQSQNLHHNPYRNAVLYCRDDGKFLMPLDCHTRQKGLGTGQKSLLE
jgi:hypothetical protein